MFPLIDVRTGFPYSLIDEDRNFVGARNQAGRYPTFVSLDTQVTTRFLFRGHRTTPSRVWPRSPCLARRRRSGA